MLFFYSEWDSSKISYFIRIYVIVLEYWLIKLKKCSPFLLLLLKIFFQLLLFWIIKLTLKSTVFHEHFINFAFVRAELFFNHAVICSFMLMKPNIMLLLCTYVCKICIIDLITLFLCVSFVKTSFHYFFCSHGLWKFMLFIHSCHNFAQMSVFIIYVI